MLLIYQRREVADHKQSFLRLPGLARKHQHVFICRNIVDPGEAVRIMIQLIKSRMLQAEMIQRLHVFPHISMILILEQLPLQAFLLIPLVKGRKLLAHKQKLLSRMHHHKAVCSPQVVKLRIPVARHLSHERSFSVHHLVMGQAQDEILTVSINHTEDQLAVMPGTEHRIIVHIAQEVIHPSHIPLEIKSKPVILHRTRHLRPGCRLLCNQERSVLALLKNGIQMLQKLYCLQVFLSAVDVRHPLSVIFSIIQIQHRGHCVHADAVCMINLCPVQGIGNQEVFHLRPAVIVDQSAPVGMAALPGIQMLIQAGAVKGCQSKGVSREMGGHPVQNHADSLAVHIVHKIHEVLRGAVPGRRRIISRHLVTPGFIQRMLHDRHQLHMGISHILHVPGKHRGDLPVIVKFPRLRQRYRFILRLFGFRLLPGAQMHLIDQDRLFPVIRLLSLLHPSAVCPLKAGQICDNGSRIGTKLRRICIRIRLQHRKAALRLDLIFIAGSRPNSGNKKLKNPCLFDAPHRMTPSIPEIEISDHADTARIWGPYRKVGTLHALYRHRMRAHFFIQGIMNARLKLVQILRRKYLWLETVGILQLLNCPIVILHTEKIFRNRLTRKQRRKKAAFVSQFHLILLARAPDHGRHPDCRRQKGLNQNSRIRLVRPENFLRLVLLRVHQRLNPRPVHKLIQPVIHTLLLLLRSEAFPPWADSG